MSNGDTTVTVRSEGPIHLLAALTIAVRYHAHGLSDTVSHMLVRDNVLYFGWHAAMGGTRLPLSDEM